MATLLKIATIGHPILRTRAREVTSTELASVETQAFIDDMIATMHDANGAGIAANQVHNPVRITVIEVKGNNPRYPEKEPIPLTILVNPVLTPLSEETFTSFEGCLSVPDLRGRVTRRAHIRVDFLDRAGVPHSREVRGIQAVTYQHECDHLDGKLFVDHAEPATLTTWKNYAAYHSG
ncbi:MAG: peptide deformylase [Myxococcota bacterium]|jgi:peptide deformylase